MSKYKQMYVSCNISSTSLGEAIARISLPQQFALFVPPCDFIETKHVLKEISAYTRDNPLAPFINLCVDDALVPREWYLECDGKRIGCKGP